MHPQEKWQIPEETKRVAYAVFKKGNSYLKIVEELGQLYEDKEFQILDRANCGKNAISPARLALITIFQFAEGLTDRQTAEAVRSRIDWKYALGLELTDEGFDFTVLSDWRKRLLANGEAEKLLTKMLWHLKEIDPLRARGKPRTDSTHVLGVIRKVNRLECMGETLRKALNDLATIAPDWLRDKVTDDWFDLYCVRFEQYRLPQKQSEKQELALRIGTDGHYLLNLLESTETPEYLRKIESMEILRQIWVQQYYLEGEQVQWRERKTLGMPPHKILLESPYDIEARNRTKRQVNWTGYAVHLTETCCEDTANLITNVLTTEATTFDGAMTQTIHGTLAHPDLLPSQHFVDSAYADARNFLVSSQDFNVELIAPPLPAPSWQARANQGFSLPSFSLDWQKQQATCPQGVTSVSWKERLNQAIEIRFPKDSCRACSSRSLCTKSQDNPRLLKVRPQPEHELLQHLRQQSKTDEFKATYNQRAGIEGTLSQACRAFGLRRSRYVGLAKTHLQHIAIACAINLTRLVAWFNGIPKCSSHTSRFAQLQTHSIPS